MDDSIRTLSFLAECEDCKKKFNVSPESGIITFNRKFVINGKSIFLTYYDCPNCGRRHYVQIDDEVSLAKLRDIKKQFGKLIAAKAKGKVSQKQSAKFKGARQNLSVYRTNLMKEYTGKLIHNNETDTDFMLRFSV